MSDESRPPELQFEHAETETPPVGAPHCAVCQLEIVGSYWEHRGRMLCDACRTKLVDSWQHGSGFGRFARAAFFGLLAAALGTLVYWAIAELTGYEFSLIALLIGFAVGGAVRYGSRGRGGWRYQALAIFLTYTSIVSTYLPALWQAVKGQDDSGQEIEVMSDEPTPPELMLREALPAEAPPVTETSPGATGALPENLSPESATPETATPDTSSPVPAGAPRTGAPEAGAMPDADASAPSSAGCLLGVLALVGFLYAAPFLAGFENFIGWIILAIGLYEAWKMNQPEDREVHGPFEVGSPGAPLPIPPAAPAE
jgi:hypothetical protein